jgi:hypothetical protein
MNRNIWRLSAPWIGLLGAVLLLAAILLAMDLPSFQPAQSYVVKVSRERMKSSLEAFIAENPRMRDDRDLLLKEMREGAVAQSLLVAEGFYQGLAENDFIVRNRIAELQVMALYEKADTMVTPEAAETYFAMHSDRYYTLPRRFYLHLFVPVTNLVDADEAARRLEKLYQNESSWGDPKWVTENQLRRRWGPTMARRIFEMPLSQWSEPIFSNFGRHRILVLKEEPERLHEFEEARTRATEDLRRELRLKTYEDEISRLKKIYKVEWTD